MKAMILCAGRGERMRPLTDTLPKPLLKVKGKALVVWHLERLARLGFKDVVINIAHLGFKIPGLLGNGSKWNLNIIYSDEQDEGALESAGGIKKALPFFDDETFLVVNGDVFCDYDFDVDFDLKNKLAHLILVPNPEHNRDGDFGIKDNLLVNNVDINYTFSGIGYYSPKLFKHLKQGKASLAPILRNEIKKQNISGEIYNNMWHDIGTPQRLENINK
ncbi:N-acetylmuramate alpha-1-phosphate uridylyltransferase MurU [Sulfurimonas sp.]|uniref:N-acetylmuramate alpha-1-phosphate uridylyltransferase MurU n=1 Tax=Sulfurimonas sp. TaxID=2022749 RepID=UPI002AB01B1F|nr:nucleotidyltransferase family protein [Sulfurimonas sp.]